jgi:NAD(P)-dependent dehydrogenase (short-subunit alcohol dehydrogenase family)
MKVALVTGVSSGIGRATAALLAASGFRTFGTVRTNVESDPAVELIRLDVRDAESVTAGVTKVLDLAGRIDVLVNSAGISFVRAAEETSLDEARDLFDTNFFGAFRMTQAVLPAMREHRGGRIVNVTSVLGFLPAPFMSMYAASKHALTGFSESLDHEVRRFGIRAISVEPGFTRTNLGHNSRSDSRGLAAYEAERERVNTRIDSAVERGADPAEVAGVVLRAINDRSPRLHYQVGREARMLRILRSIAPFGLLDNGIRKSFGLGTAS